MWFIARIGIILAIISILRTQLGSGTTNKSEELMRSRTENAANEESIGRQAEVIEFLKDSEPVDARTECMYYRILVAN
jgi:hypothetical protein